MDKTKPFGLVLPKRSQTFRPKSAVFGDDSDDEPPKGKKFCTKIPQAKPSKLVTEAPKLDDPSIYEYDSIYDDMKAQEVAKIAPKDVNKPSRYIQSLLKAADKRKKQYERRVEKKVQNEREKEGDEFADKDAFVTSSYKQKLLEREEEEEKERRENMLNDMMDVTKQKDLSGFYRHFLKQSVGEEKVPEFGERDKVKKEVGNTSDTEGRHHSPVDTVQIKQEECSDQESAEPQEDLDKDSDILSSSDEEIDDSLNRKGQKDNSISDTRSRKSSEKVSEKKLAAKGSTNKRKRNIDEDSESSVDSDSLKKDKDLSKENDSSNEDDVNSSDKLAKEAEPKRSREDIFAKRTVGLAFAEAQARYFQRVAARSS